MIDLKVVLKDIPECWIPILNNPNAITNLKRILSNLTENNLAPRPENIFNSLRYISNLADISAIIVGQDPYIKFGEAHGFSFSVPVGVKIPPSLANVYSAIKTQVFNGNLEYWASQGIILLNTALTTTLGESNAHSLIWMDYTDYLLKEILAVRPNIALILWGNHAHKKAGYAHKETLVLKWGHPSPLGNNNQPENKKFDKCSHFGETNDFLIKTGQPPIDWQCGTISKLIIFTDGSAMANGTNNCAAGWGVFVPAAPFCTPFGRRSCFIGNTENVSLAGQVTGTSFGPATNNRAELGAILQGLLWLLQNKKPPFIVTIVSDSAYSIGMITEWGPKHIQSNSLHEKKNPELVKLIIDVLAKAREDGFIIDFMHIRGHQKDVKYCKEYIFANEIVDILAGSCVKS